MNLPYRVVFLILAGVALGSYVGFMFTLDDISSLILSAVVLAHVLVVGVLAEWAVTKWKRNRRVYK